MATDRPLEHLELKVWIDPKGYELRLFYRGCEQMHQRRDFAEERDVVGRRETLTEALLRAVNRWRKDNP